jgi:hypothetical protein
LPVPPNLRQLSGAITEEGDRLRLKVPVAVFRKVALPAILLAPAVFGLVLLFGLLTVGDDIQGWVLSGLCGLALSGLVGLVGVVGLFTASGRSEISGCTLDKGAGTLTLNATGEVIPLGQLRRLRVNKTNVYLKFFALMADGPRGRLILLDDIPPGAAPELAQIGDAVGAFLGQPVEVESWVRSASSFSMDDHTASLFCWMPFQGLYLVFSLWYLLMAGGRPFVAFHARQSLAQLVLSLFGVGLSVASGAAVHFAGQAARLPQEAGILAMALPLMAVFGWNLLSRLYMCWAAWKGQSAVLPWLRPFFRAPPAALGPRR